MAATSHHFDVREQTKYFDQGLPAEALRPHFVTFMCECAHVCLANTYVRTGENNQPLDWQMYLFCLRTQRPQLYTILSQLIHTGPILFGLISTSLSCVTCC